MNRPSPEDFANAPLFVPYVHDEPDARWTDYSAERVVIEGFVLTREPLDANGMRFKLEGHDVLDVVPRVEDGVPTWVGTAFDGKVRKIHNVEAATAAAEFAGMLHESLRQRADGLVFYMEERGVHLGREAVGLDRDEYRGYDGDEDEENEDDEEDYGAVTTPQRRFGAPVRIVREGFSAWVEDRDAQEPWGRLREGFARSAEDGTPVCPASQPITSQIDVLERAEGDVARHRADLRSLRASVGNPAEIMDLGLRAGVHIFDMVDSDRQDAVVPQAAILAYRNDQNTRWERQGAYEDAVERAIADGTEPPEPLQEIVLVDPTAMPAPRHAERPLGELIEETTGFRVGSFTEVRDMPNYIRQQIRAIGRDLLGPHIGDFPMERVVVGRPSSNDPEAYAAFMAYFREGELVKDIGEFTHPNMPGYRTSPAEHRRRDGWDSIVFSDFNGTYAYSFASPAPANDLDPEAAEPEDDAPRMGM